jgi:type III secretion protein R
MTAPLGIGAGPPPAAWDAVSSGPLGSALVVAALAVVPFVALLLTSFVRISVVLAILRSAFGPVGVPPAAIVTGLSLLLTAVVMAPTAERMYRAAAPVLEPPARARGGTLAEVGAVATRAVEPLRQFLLANAAPRDRAAFQDLNRRLRPGEAAPDDTDLAVLAPAFVVSELRRAFEIGFLLFIPFLVLELVVASVLTALGLQTLSPTAVSLPLKLLLFVLVDGWMLLLRGLVEGYV